MSFSPAPDRAEPPPSPVAAAPAGWRRTLSRFSAYSDFWSRFVGWAARWCPFFTESLLVLGYTVLFFAASPQQRRAIRGNLRVLKPEWGAVRRFFASFAVFWEFACTIADAVRAREDAGLFTWSLEGAGHFEKLAATARGSLILTAHMGNYDVAAPFFATQLGRPFTSVRLPERRPELQAYMDEIRARQETANFHIRYNRPGEFLAVDLAHALAAGEIIGLQGDRAPGEVSTVHGVLNGHEWPLPRGPLVLAMAARAPIFPLFVVRTAWRQYRITMLPPWVPDREKIGRGDKDAAFSALLGWWNGVLNGFIATHWSKWLTFEPAFGGPTADAAPPAVAIEPVAPATAENRPSSADRDLDLPAARSRTALFRWIDVLTGRAAQRPERYEVWPQNATQNPLETKVLNITFGLVSAAAAFQVLSGTALPLWAAALLTPAAAFLLLHVVLLSLLFLGGVVERLGGELAPSHITRATEYAHVLLATLYILTSDAPWLRPLVWIWVGGLVLNGLCHLTLPVRSSPGGPASDVEKPFLSSDPTA